MEKIKIKKLRDGAQMPYYASPGAAGADVYACLEESIRLKPGERGRIPTGIALELPGPEIVALIFARSGLAAKQGLALTNGVGVLDSDYRGELQILVVNLGQEEILLKNRDRIAQIAFVPVCQAAFTETEELSATERGTGGFGSTGYRV